MENEECMELISSMDNEFIRLCKEVDILEKNIEKQRLHVQTMKLKIGAETTNFNEQVKISINNGTTEGHDKNTRDINEKDMQQLEQQVQCKEIYQPREKLDSEIEKMRPLMVKVSQKIHEDKNNIYISRERKQINNRKHLTKEDCRSKANGALQQKVWNP